MDKITETIKNVLSVLLEGRLEDVKAKYSDSPNSEQIIDSLSQGDPSGNNKYLDWMSKISFTDTTDFTLEEILGVVTNYHEGLQRLTSQISTPIVDANKDSFPGRSEKRVKNNPKDISGYPSLTSLRLIIAALEETKKERPDRDSIYQDNRWTVIVPKTHEAACKYGVHSNWCVSTSNTQYFKQYTKEKDALLFFILWRNKYSTEDKTEYKVAINAEFRDWEDPRKWDWYDMPDQEIDPKLMLNIFPSTMIEVVQKYLISEGKKQGKIVNPQEIIKLVDDNYKYKFGEKDGHIYFTTDNIEAFSQLPNYGNNFRYGGYEDVDGVNTVVYINKVNGELRTNSLNGDIWSEGRNRRNDNGERYVEPSSLRVYTNWLRYKNNNDFVKYLYDLPSDLEFPQELRDEIETKVKEELSNLGGMWIKTNTENLNVGDTVRWKKGRGYWDQRNNQWNESTVDRQTPAGFLVTGKTEEFPKGKRFKPSYNSAMDVWHSFGGDINLNQH